MHKTSKQHQLHAYNRDVNKAREAEAWTLEAEAWTLEAEAWTFLAEAWTLEAETEA